MAKSKKVPIERAATDKSAEAVFAELGKLAGGALASGSSLALQLQRISSGCFGLDVATYGGYPQGRVVMHIGPEKSAKTGSFWNAAATFQAQHCSECFRKECDCKHRDVPYVFLADAEHRTHDMLYWPKGHGVNIDRLKILSPPSGQHVVDLVDGVIRNADKAKCGLIIVDSLAHIVSQEELSKLALDGDTIGRNAKLLNSAWRKWTSALNELCARLVSSGIENPTLPTILCVNQLRSKIGVVMGSPDVLPGGAGQRYATSLDIRFSAGPDTYVVWDAKKNDWVAKQKGYKSTFKPSPDASPDFIQVNYRVSASGVCPKGRSGSFNYWLKAAHGHRIGDPDNGFQLWHYAKTYLLQQEGHEKFLVGFPDMRARTIDELERKFRVDKDVQAKVWPILMERLIKDEPTEDGNQAEEPVDDVISVGEE